MLDPLPPVSLPRCHARACIRLQIKEDIPTGTTPVRQQFAYPRDLVRTRPHDAILEEFRKASSEAAAKQDEAEEVIGEEPEAGNQENTEE